MTTAQSPLVSWERLKSTLLDLLYPPRCAGCDSRGAWFCARCVEQLARPVAPAVSLSESQFPTLGGLRFVAYFEGPLRRAVHQLKYRGCRAVAPALGHLMAQALLAGSPPCDLLIPVPLHAQRLRERGYNQAALLAQAVGSELPAPIKTTPTRAVGCAGGSAPRALGVPVHTDALVRSRETRSQTKLNAAERRENVRGAFAVLPAAVGSVEGRAVVVVDDVCTTGATLEACAVALRQAGARSVWGLTLGRER